MKVRAELQLTLAEPGRDRSIELDLEQGATVGHALGRLGLKEGDVGLVVRNGISLEAHEALRDGDILLIFPPLSGG